MALDGVLLNGLSRELETELAGGRLDKIQQPEKDEIHLTLRNKGNNYRLLLSASASHPRIHLTEQSKTNPLVPPMFCMVLRKHLSNSRLISVQQPGMERILEIGFETIDELGDLTVKKLTIEIMGRHSNIILRNSDDHILDAIKHIDSSISRVREVLPGRMYTYPPSQGKTNPLEANGDHVSGQLLSSEPGSSPVNVLTRSYMGVSKVTAEELFYRSDQKLSGLPSTFVEFFNLVRNNQWQPVVFMDPAGKPMDIFPMVYTVYDIGSLKTFPSFSKAMDEFFRLRDGLERIRQRTTNLHRVIKNNLDRCHRKLGMQVEELEKAKGAENFRLFGELITSNIYQIPAGAEEVSVVNYYDPDSSIITIPLDPIKTSAQNAQSYFKKYNKARTVQEVQSRFMKETREEIQYLESISQNLSMCTDENDILEIQQELIQQGYLKEQKKGKKAKRKLPVSSPHHFLSSDGFEIFVGKNNIQNDLLTLKSSYPHDLWFHTKTIQGSHVIVKTNRQTIPETTLLEAANLAAYFSKGRSSANVPVDYCPRKNVKKPGGAKPGMVIYEQYNTIYITPSEEKVLAMKKP